jgi:hypothetical protein
MFVLGWAAHRLRSRALAVAAVAALVVTIIAFPLSGAQDDSGARAVFGVLVVFGLIGGGLTATFMVRRRLVDPSYQDHTRSRFEVSRPPRSVPRTGRVDPAIDDALKGRQRRSEARRILERDPALARELKIGRPDLPRRFDDGGLVDVNHVPATVLAALPGFTPELAARVARARDEHHGFDFLQEMEVFADLPDGLADELAERLIFLR